MKNKFLGVISLALLAAMLAAIIPQTVYAADVISVTPGTIMNDVATNITVTGTGFDDTAAVLLDGGALNTSFLNNQTLTATVPAGTSPGTHTITVSMSGGNANGSASLMVQAPTPVPPTSTPKPLPFTRPQFVVRSSKITGTMQTGASVTLKVVLENAGNASAYSSQAAFSSTDLVPTKNGGVAIVGTVEADNEVDVSQTFYVAGQITGMGIVVVDLTISYYDDKGASYSDKFTLSVPVNGNATSSSGGSVAATATPTGVKSSQLVITGYSTSIDPLQPGSQFSLNITVKNVGNANAQNITMIVGGGTSGSGGATPQPGGVSGGSGDFTNFAPVGSSNIQSLGNLKSGGIIQAKQNLIVNVSTNPGAYPMHITFSYLNEKNEVINDEQVITMLVYSLPNIDISFYRPADPFFTGQPGVLPIQIVNIGKRAIVLGNMKVETENGVIENGTSLVGSLDVGGYFTLDTILTPDQPGTTTLKITIDYVDDFNEPRVITDTLEVEVSEEMIDPMTDPSQNGGGGGEVIVDGGEFTPMVPETPWQKAWRFVLGLFGLDSSTTSTTTGSGTEEPMQETVPVQPVPGKG